MKETNRHPVSEKSSPLKYDSDFIALAVNDGDAFLLRRGDDVILVDGGNKNDDFPNQVKECVSSGRIDVVVCTHNDLDHTGGILKLLESTLNGSELEIGEVWLPAQWSEKLVDLAADPLYVVSKLIDEMSRAEYFQDDNPAQLPTEQQIFASLEDSRKDQVQWTKDLEASLEEIAREENERNRPLSEEYPYSFDEPPSSYSWLPEQFRQRDLGQRYKAIKDLVNRPAAAPFNVRDVLRDSADLLGLNFTGNTVWLRQLRDQYDDFSNVVELLKNIRRIALAAYAQDINIVWFKHDLRYPGKCPRHDIRPLNASQLETLPSHLPDLSPYIFAKQSSKNERCLTFYAAPAGGVKQGGVLFTADSDLSFNAAPGGSKKIPADPAMLVTTPHHGSDKNALAYVPLLQILDLELALFVRSGRKEASWPGKGYLQLQTRKACTRCRNEQGEEQNVYLTFTNSWMLSRSNECSCKADGTWAST